MRRQIYRYLFTDIDICLYVTNISFENTIQLIIPIVTEDQHVTLWSQNNTK